ncbi:MAG: helix-turn-helix domain-containing protein [Planctomycetales bacterium]|nr:helix-turn-helix domain-containing protein [Planctomycetales bacterium]
MTLARLAEHLGVNVGTIVRWESGTFRPRGLYVRAIETWIARVERGEGKR